jgi:hypothetical protein
MALGRADNQPIATPATVNPDSAYQVMVSESTIDSPLSDLLASNHAVMVYASDEDMTGVACGNIGGAMVGDTLITGLGEMGSPGHSGFAIFTPQGDKTNVELIIGHGLGGMASMSGISGMSGMSGMNMSGQENSNGMGNMATPTP